MAGTPAAAAGPLSAADIDAFNRDGFVLLRGFFSPEDVATARAGLDVLTDQRRYVVSSWFASSKQPSSALRHLHWVCCNACMGR